MPSQSGNFNQSVDYEWWNHSWVFRFAVEINSSSMARYFWQNDFRLNFTEILTQGNASGNFDNRSVRVVEYNSTGLMAIYNGSATGIQKYVIPSRFIPDKVYFNAQTNATGNLYFPLTGDTAKNTNRTFYIYFDTLEHGSKTNQFELPWDKNYFGVTDPARDRKYRIASGCQSDTGGNNGREYIFSNGASEWSVQLSAWTNAQYCANVVYDWNQDGKLEIGFFNYEAHQMMFYTYVSAGVMSQFISSPITLSSDYPSSAAIGDVDGDGTMELVIASKQDYGILIYSYQTSSPYFVLENYITTPSTNLYLGSLAVCDLDKDGYPEIIGGSTSGGSASQRLYIWEYNPASLDYAVRLNSGDVTKYQYCDNIHCGDFDFDGNYEMIFSQSYNSSSFGQVYVWQCTGDNTYSHEMTFSCGLTYPLIGDVIDYDDDGRYELIITRNYDSGNYVRIFEYIGNGAINASYEKSYTTNDAYSPVMHPLIVDYDNDGSIEVAVNGQNGYIYFYEIGGSGSSYGDFGNYIGGPMGQNFFVLGRRRTCDAYPDLLTCVYPLEIASTSLILTLKDNDNNTVERAKVSIINPITAESIADPVYSDGTGKVSFWGISCKDSSQFNITVHLISSNPLFPEGPMLLYNQTVQVSSETYTSTIILTVWTIKFNITDYSLNPLTQGFVAIYNDSSRLSTQLVANLTLSQSGMCTFQWTNRSYYNYTVYYHNPYYANPFVVLSNDSAGITHDGNETSTVQLQAPLTQAHITIVDSQSIAAAGVKVSFFVNNTDLVAQLYTNGYGEVRDGQGQLFMHLLSAQIGSNYTIRLMYYNSPKDFRNKSDVSDIAASSKNFTLEIGTEILYEINLNASQYQLIARELDSSGTFSLPFRGSAHFLIELNATCSEPNYEKNEMVDADSTALEVRDFLTRQLVFSSVLNHVSTGLYNFTLNASALGIMAGRNYYATITVVAYGYGNQPSPLLYTFDVQAINTTIGFENNQSQPISSISAYWGQNLTIFVSYLDDEWNEGILDAIGSCWWDYGTYPLQPVTGHSGYYSVNISTETVDSVGPKTLHFQIGKTNYTSYADFSFSTDILEITTRLNGSEDYFERLNIQLYRTEARNFTIEYFDIINKCGIESALTTTYVWKKYDANSQLVDTGTGDLLDIGTGLYVLDFDTENLDGEKYTFLISLDKPNYSPKFGFVSFDINPIPLQAIFSDNLRLSAFSVVLPNKGYAEMTVSLADPIFGRPMDAATVTLEIDGYVHNFSDVGQGTYHYIFNASGYDALVTDLVMSGKIKIQVANYTTITQDVKLTIKMDELLPGISRFYFFVVMGFIFTIVGIPLFMKGIRYWKTPPFIKRANSIKKTIERQKKTRIQKDVDYSVEELIKRQYRDRWFLFKIDITKKDLKNPKQQERAV